MTLEYIYGKQANLYSFIHLPRVLITEPKFADMSGNAKILYAIILDKASQYSAKKWIDQKGRLFIDYPMEELAEDLHCSKQTVGMCISELESVGLIEQRLRSDGTTMALYPKQIQYVRNV